MLAFLNGLVDQLTGSVWTYPLLFGICAGDAVFPALNKATFFLVGHNPVAVGGQAAITRRSDGTVGLGSVCP